MTDIVPTEELMRPRSASAVSTFRLCTRKWAWRYLAGIDAPENASAALGKEVHACLEGYLKGEDIDFTTKAGQIAASSTHLLPEPHTPFMRIEEEFLFASPSGHRYLGYKDIELPGVVYDHKTTGNAQYAKTTEDLLEDPQAILYAVDVFRRYPHLPAVVLRWNYMLTKEVRKAWQVEAHITREQAAQGFREIEATADAMAAIEKGLGLYEPKHYVASLPFNSEACQAFGGCPYQASCNLSPIERLRSIMSQGVNPLLQKLKQNSAAQPSTVVTQVPPPVNPLLTATHGIAGLATHAGTGVLPGQINPPESALPPHVPVEAPAEAEKPKRGRPAKAAVTPAPTVHTEIAASQVAAGHEALPHAPGKKIGVLYINCHPQGVATVDASIFLQAAKARIFAEHQLADYRFADYGKGPGMLCVDTAHEIDAQQGSIGHVTVDSRIPDYQVVLGELISRASLVVRGI